MRNTDTLKNRSLLIIASALLAGSAAVAQPQPVTDSSTGQEEGYADKEEVIRNQELPITEEESHSSREADDALLQQASQNPSLYVGRTLMLKTGKIVGEITDVRRKLDNLRLYLVVDATPYFNAPTNYAVAVRDVEAILEGNVLISEDKGMHLRGLTYYEQDYTAADENFPEEAIEEGSAENP